MDFEKFLTDNAIGRTDCVCKECGTQNIVEFHKDGHLRVNALGEWAWKEFLDINSRTSVDYFSDFERVANNYPNIGLVVYWKQAVACLGKKEIQKRLEELK